MEFFFFCFVNIIQQYTEISNTMLMSDFFQTSKHDDIQLFDQTIIQFVTLRS